MKKVARMLRAQRRVILIGFAPRRDLRRRPGRTHNKIRVVTRRSYGFRTYEAMEIALYHNFGRLPEPESPHRFC